jgi:hypothetical protein
VELECQDTWESKEASRECRYSSDVELDADERMLLGEPVPLVELEEPVRDSFSAEFRLGRI